MPRFLSLIALIVLASPVAAQEGEFDAGRTLGGALDLYNRGQVNQAYPLLSRVIEAGSRDPRAYYFRGLSAWQLGNPSQAQQDFRTGAELEANNADPLGMTSIQMYRVQGRARLMLEQYRADAKLAAYKLREKLRWERFGAVDAETPAAGNAPSAGAAPAPGSPPPAAVPTKTPDDPFAPKPAAPSTPPAAPAAPPADPFQKK